MVKLESLKKIGIPDNKIERWTKSCYIYIENEMVDIISEDVYLEIMRIILMQYPSMFAEFIDYSYNASLVQYHQFLKSTLDGKIDESQKLMRSLLKDKDFLEKYEDILLFVSIIEEYKLKDLYIPEEENPLVQSQIFLYKKYLLSFNYPMAHEVLKKIRKIHDCLEYRVMDAILIGKRDTIKYILKPDIYPSAVTNDNLKRIEREALCSLELGEYNSFIKKIAELNHIYQNQDRNCFQIILMLINEINKLEHNKRFVSSRSMFNLNGDFNSVLIALLTSRDYYRAHDLIEEELRNSQQFDIYLIMIFILIHTVMYFNKNNIEFLERQLNTANCTNIDDFFKGKTIFSKIDGNIIKRCEEQNNANEKNKINHYQMYKDAFNRHSYTLARDYLDRFLARLKSINININLGYLYKELDYLMVHEQEMPERNLEDIITKQKLALRYIENKNYEEAIIAIEQWCNSLNYFHPRAQALLAKCYLEQKDFSSALKIYEESNNYYLYPLDYEDIIICLFNLGKYDKMEYYFNLRENYEYSSLKIYYIMSIAAIKETNYEKAKSYLLKAEEVGLELYNYVPDYHKEIEIIDGLIAGKDVREYNLDDYIEYGFTEADELILDEVESYKKEYHEDYITMLLISISNKSISPKERVEYLLSVVKILKFNDKSVALNPIYEYINKILASNELSTKEARLFTLTMKNYQNL